MSDETATTIVDGAASMGIQVNVLRRGGKDWREPPVQSAVIFANLIVPDVALKQTVATAKDERWWGPLKSVEVARAIACAALLRAIAVEHRPLNPRTNAATLEGIS